MQTEKILLGELKLIGTTIRTNMQNEMNPATAKIGEHFLSDFENNLADRINNRLSPHVTYSIYTEYHSDEYGDYTHFIGEVVTSLDNQNLAQFNKLIIPAGQYQKFTTAAGNMPAIVIDAWQQIWKMSPNDLGGIRTYIADFEIYDQRAYVPNNAIVDIFIGIT